jgi:hypothetical protein
LTATAIAAGVQRVCGAHCIAPGRWSLCALRMLTNSAGAGIVSGRRSPLPCSLCAACLLALSLAIPDLCVHGIHCWASSNAHRPCKRSVIFTTRRRVCLTACEFLCAHWSAQLCPSSRMPVGMTPACNWMASSMILMMPSSQAAAMYVSWWSVRVCLVLIIGFDCFHPDLLLPVFVQDASSGSAPRVSSAQQTHDTAWHCRDAAISEPSFLPLL